MTLDRVDVERRTKGKYGEVDSKDACAHGGAESCSYGRVRRSLANLVTYARRGDPDRAKARR